MYDPPANPHDVLKLIELLSEEVLDTIAPKLVSNKIYLMSVLKCYLMQINGRLSK